jgi:hypothetical protein
MGIGALLVGVALALVTGVFLARPFRKGGAGDLDQTIEDWVLQARAHSSPADLPSAPDSGIEDHKIAITGAYCSQCGSRVGPDARFCSHCGARLPEPPL